MKKNILKAILVAAFALIAGFNVYNAQKSDVMSDLALANVEALASGESSTTNRYQTMGYKPYVELQKMVGLSDVKKVTDEILAAAKVQKMRKQMGLLFHS